MLLQARLTSLLFFFSLLITTIYAQPPNDDCSSAELITALDGDCINFTTTMATFDLADGDCVPNPNDINIWYEFTAQGNDIDITVTSNDGQDVYVTLLLFDPTPCDFTSALQLACGSANGGGSAITLNDALVIGQKYYLIITLGAGEEGAGKFCIDNPVPLPTPPNDDGCGATTINDDCVSTQGTTLGANIDFTNAPGGCDLANQVGVFYDFTLSTGNNAASIDVTGGNLSGDVTVMLGAWDPDCSGNFTLFDIYCGPKGSDLLDISGLTEGSNYSVWVGSEESVAGTFNLAVCGYGPPPGCSQNDMCSTAEVISGVVSDQAYVCVSGCNIGASPENNLSGCSMSTEEVVWFKFTTDAVASLASFYINSDMDMPNPTMQIFSGNCNGLIEESPCASGNNNFVQILTIDVFPNTTYYIAVSQEFGDGGMFDLCVQTLDDPSSCTLSASLEVVGTSLGSPFSGPFKPSEQVEFCYNISQYTPIGNGCQWLQGIIPIFGCAWDDASFNGVGMPTNITVPLSTVYGGTWGWYTDITYNATVSTKSVGDFDGDGDLDMCHFTEPNCPNTGINAGQLMPPGWYAWTPNGPPDGHPNIDWGDGSGCGNIMGGWQVCFILTAKSAPECETCEDASVKFYTTSDGETGDWNGGPSTCASDIPETLDLNVNCCIGPELDQPLEETICSESTSALELFSDQDPDVTYEWTPIPNSNITGATAGSGKFITQTLTNNTSVIQTQQYEVTPTSADGCPGLPQIVEIHVLPAIIVDAGPDIEGCAQGMFTLGGSPTASGGAGGFSFDWGNSAIDNVANPQASPNIPTTYTVTVTDANGCTSTDDIFLDINPNFDVEINGVTEICESDPTSFLTSTPLGGTPGYTYEWTGPGTGGGTSSTVYFNGVGLNPGIYTITVTVTDANGCTGDQEQDIQINQSPNIFLFTDPTNGAFCPGGSVTIDAIVSSTPGSTLQYNWTTPDGPKNGSTIVATSAGEYIIEVVDDAGCAGTESIMIIEVPTPDPIINGPLGICMGDEVTLTLDTIYESYLWDDDSTTDSITVSAGTYAVTVTNIGGCTGDAEITIIEYNNPDVSIAGSTAFCEGSSTVLSATKGFNFYQWTDANNNVISNQDSVQIFDEGVINLLVEDSNGCSNETSVNVTIQDFLVPNVLGDTTICPTDCTTLDAGSGYQGYKWSNDSTTQSISVCEPGSYTVTVTDSGGCTGELTKTVTENELPNPQITTSSGVEFICPDASIELDAGDFISYLWNTDDTSQKLTVDQAGIYTVTVTDEEGCQATNDIEIVQVENPDPGYSGDLYICQGVPSTSITPEAGYVLYEIDINNDGLIDITNTDNTAYTVNVAGNSNIMVTDSNGCTGSVLVTVEELEAPSPQTVLDTASYCVGGEVTIALTENYNTITWYDPTSNIVGNTQSIQVNQPGIYTIEVVNEFGCTGSTETVVIESTELSPSIIGDTKMCDLMPIELDAGDGYNNYDWGPNGNTQKITVSSPGDYSVTVYDAGGCSGEAIITIQNFDSPKVTIEGGAFICNSIDGVEGVLLDFNSLISGSDGYWSDLDGIGVDLITDISNVSFEGIPAGTYKFSFTTTTAVAPCENIEEFILIEVGDCDCPNVATSPIPNLCMDGSPIDLNDFKNNNENGSWSIILGGGNPLSGNTFDPSLADEGTYTVRFTLDNPVVDCDEFSEQSFEVFNLPSAGQSGLPIKVCFGSQQNVDLAELLDDEYSGGVWSEISSNPSTGVAFDPTGFFETIDQNTGVYLFQYKVEGQAPCGADSSFVTVEIVPNPIADAGSDKSLDCETTEVQLGGNSQGNGLTFKWSELKGVVINNPTNENIIVSDDGSYVIEVTDLNQCLDTDTTVVVKLDDIPNLELEGTDPKCADESNGIIETNVTGGTGPFEYSIDNGQTWVSNTGFLDLPAGTYTVLVKDSNGCIDEQELSLTNPPVLVSDIEGEIYLTTQKSTKLQLNTNFNDADISNVIWYVDGEKVCEGASCKEFEVEVLENGNYEVCVEVTTLNGCFDKDCVTIRKATIKSVYLPNVFSPNSDNNNDYFYVSSDDQVTDILIFRVFDRWGNRVFNAENIKPNIPQEGWDGSYNDKPVLQGVYNYLIEVQFDDETTEQIQGTVTVIK